MRRKRERKKRGKRKRKRVGERVLERENPEIFKNCFKTLNNPVDISKPSPCRTKKINEGKINNIKS